MSCGVDVIRGLDRSKLDGQTEDCLPKGILVMPKEFDKQVLTTTVMGVVESTFEQMLHVKFGAEPVVADKDIIEFDSRMRLFPMEKFNGPCFISTINYFLSEKDQENGRAVGTFVFYVKEDIAEKLLKAFNRSTKDAEHEEILLDIVGEMTNILAGNVKNELTSIEYVDLTMSAPNKYKNHVPEGVLFNYNLYQKQEITFTFWAQKCIIIDVCMGYVPHKSK